MGIVKSEPPECEDNGWKASAEPLGGSGWILAALTLGAGTGTGANWTPVTPTRGTGTAAGVGWVTAALALGASKGMGDGCASAAPSRGIGTGAGTC